MKISDFVKIDEDVDVTGTYVTPEIVVVPDKYVDGIHTTNLMPKSMFPIKILVRSTGHILYVHGFVKDLMVYTSTFNAGGLYASSNGMYKGKLGEDFLYI